MATIAFIGVGNMGLPMAINLLKAGHALRAFDVSSDALAKVVAEGATPCDDAPAALDGSDVVITMLPAGEHVREVYLEQLAGTLSAGMLAIDCSTIDVASARQVHQAMSRIGVDCLDAPVSGGVMGAAAGTLAFMCGGTEAAFARAKPLLDVMGANIIHTGGPGNGQAAKICNNMILGIQMLAVCEGFTLADRLGLDRQTLFDVASKASGQSWALTSYCPVPGPVPNSPANNDYKAGFSTAMMLKDMKLSQAESAANDFDSKMGALATTLYQRYFDRGEGAGDFSGIFRMISEQS